MGQIFSGPTPPSYSFKLDFDNTKPADSSGEIDVAGLLERTRAALDEIQNYKSCQGAIKKAIEAPKDAQINTDAAVALKDNILAIKSWYDLAEDMAAVLPQIAAKISEKGAVTEDPELTVALGQLVAFMYRFDQAKLYESGIQNDFSGYRRVMNKCSGIELPLDESAASVVSMFVAQPGPFAHRLGTAFKDVPDKSRLVVAELCNASCGAIDRSKGKAVLPEPTVDLYRHVMVGCIILYDRGSNGGAFSSAQIAILKCCTAAKKRGGVDTAKLCSALKYSTVTFNTASDRIQDLLED